jgi:ribosomal-protein-alanine N-acetyltransferase
MIIAQSTRLVLRHIHVDDAEFLLQLLNDPDFIRYVGDKQVRDLEAAQDYIRLGPAASYETHGYGLYLVELIDSRVAIGICGLLKRDFLDSPDLGFALMPSYRGLGYAFEAAQLTMELAADRFELSKIAAFTATDNSASIKLLERLGMKYKNLLTLPGTDHQVSVFIQEIRSEVYAGKK